MKNERMVRKQIYLAPEQSNQVKKISALYGKTEAEIIREAIDDYLVRNQINQEDPLLELAGIVKSSANNASTKHDEDIYLAEKGNLDQKR